MGWFDKKKNEEFEFETKINFISTEDGTKYASILDMINLFKNSIAQYDPITDTKIILFLNQLIEQFENSEKA